MSFRKFQEMVLGGYREAADDDGSKAGGAGAGAEGGDNGGDTGGDTGGAGDDAGDGEGGGSDDDGNDDDGGEQGNKKPTDSEAKLLKESMKRKELLKKAQLELEKAQKELKKFEGIDLNKVQELMKAAKDAETKKLEEKGQWDALKAQMVEQHKAEVERVQNQVKELQDALGSKESVINKLTIGHAFDSSKFISEELTLTPSKARIVYGEHFDIVDGELVAFDKPRGAQNRTQLVDSNGDVLGFEAALKKIVDGDPDRDSIVRSKAKQGADSKTITGKKPPANVEVHGREKIAAALNKSSGN